MPLNPGLIRDTFTEVEKQTERATAYFYGRLFAENPRLRAMFPPAMDVQRDRLFSALVTIVQNLESPDTLSGFLGHLGRDHRKFGVEAGHYDAVGAALLTTVRKFSGTAWSVEAAQAWSDAYALAARMMIEAAEEHSAWAPPWWHAEVIDLERPCRDLARITLRPNQPYSYLPGQYLSLQAARWPRVWRSYSIANAPRNDNLLRLVVRGVAGGWVSNALVTHTRLGDRVLLGPPLGSMVLDATSDRDLVCVAGGSGIAPVKAILEQVVSLPNRRNVVLLYGAGDRDHLSEIPDLMKLRATYPWLRVVSVLERESDDERLSREAPDGESIGEVVHGRLRDALPALGSLADHDAYVCGPPEMVRAMVPDLRAAGVRRSRIYHDLTAIGEEQSGSREETEAEEHDLAAPAATAADEILDRSAL
ncbi:globin domain-containing protein [Nocardiopsis ansamitocini]|uniref:nitric oxide dioxygenase n=1 Tax=Nocardiopsis ansamitocini TaxID=1670832 RepID=A0A9W6P2A5_9ACTN|nr:globin domain-containing protein [Nocardiopsis ansamitocini]GLU45802.1 oxidoreductase [Nocardiopsis ansamitocini]